MEEKIDFIVPWVDSSNKQWKQKKNFYANKEINNKKVMVNSNSDERYRDYDTLKYLFRGIHEFTPWVNHIFLVTDNQVPSWLNIKSVKLTVVDHRDFINPKFLPTFNSNVIENNIYKIKNLSNKFVCFNDDLIINSYIKPSDFFLNGKPRDYRIYRSIAPKEDFDYIPFSDIELINQFIKGKWPLSKKGLFSLSYGKEQVHNIVQLCRNWITGYNDPHNALSFTKTSFELANVLWKDRIYNNNFHKFRQFNDISIWLVRYLQLELGLFEPRNKNFSQYYSLENITEIKKDLCNNNHKILCINDDENIDFEQFSLKLKKLLNDKFPYKSVFEI